MARSSGREWQKHRGINRKQRFTAGSRSACYVPVRTSGKEAWQEKSTAREHSSATDIARMHAGLH